ncbi:hypothetical protein HYU95_03995 [Candidatus Daviesbacteria bacterium]|nr:hypothetical protein [Candidatus Daviesbacteria bacterium]
MRNKKERIGFFIHPSARENWKTKATNLYERTPFSYVEELKFPFNHQLENTSAVVVVAGDGSIRSVSESLMAREDPPALVIIPGGSHNGVFRALKDANISVSVDQLIEGELDKIPLFRPGLINNQLFNHFTGWGELELLHARTSENLRRFFYPRNYRMFAAGFFAITRSLRMQDNPEYLMRIAITSPFVGPIKAVPDQDMYSDKLTLLSVQSAPTRLQSAAKLGRLLFHSLARLRLPENILSVESSASFEFEYAGKISKANADGQIVDITNNNRISIRRHDKGLKIAALI